MARSLLVSWATLTISLHWATLWAISFSQKTCLPAFIAWIATGAWRKRGSAITTISTEVSASISLTSAYFLILATSAVE